MEKTFSFKLHGSKGTARAGEIITPHGRVETPIFMPVGTAASVKSLDAQDITATKAPIILANTYHLYLRPGMEVLEQAGGVQQFMQWHKPVLTDSGGFQVFSLGAQQRRIALKTSGEPGVAQQLSPAKISDEGVEFSSHLDGSKHFFTPEKSIQIQQQIGADIIMSFDECVADDAERKYVEQAVARTHDWAQRGVAQWKQAEKKSVYGGYQALFGIIQGSLFEDLRVHSAEYITSLPFDGIAVGGETIGYNMAGTAQVMSWIEQLLPKDKPRYAMGLGRDPQDIIDAILMGFDMFDCVGPTRLARNGSLYSGTLAFKSTGPVFESEFENGRLSIGAARYRSDTEVLQDGCDCYTCTSGYTRSYLHHLYRSKEISYYRLASIHNIRFMVRLAQGMREYILE
jgi:queuine tRNA-ribosyltransferase